MFVCQDVDYLLDELRGRHMVTIFGRSDQVVTHFLLIALLCSVLSTVRLRGERRDVLETLHLQMSHSVYCKNVHNYVSHGI